MFTEACSRKTKKFRCVNLCVYYLKVTAISCGPYDSTEAMQTEQGGATGAARGSERMSDESDLRNQSKWVRRRSRGRNDVLVTEKSSGIGGWARRCCLHALSLQCLRGEGCSGGEVGLYVGFAGKWIWMRLLPHWNHFIKTECHEYIQNKKL